MASAIVNMDADRLTFWATFRKGGGRYSDALTISSAEPVGAQGCIVDSGADVLTFAQKTGAKRVFLFTNWHEVKHLSESKINERLTRMQHEHATRFDDLASFGDA